MYAHVFVAGTFDRLHAGHRRLLTEAFRVGDRVTIGLTSDEFVEKYKSQIPSHKSQKERKRSLASWLKNNKFTDSSTIIAIDDPYEPAASATNVDALVVTSETRKRGEEINRMRKSRGLKELVLMNVSLVDAVDGTPISSSRIRNGDIDYEGRLVMPEELRPLLAEPLDKILTGKAIEEAIQDARAGFVITVGDVATKTFLDAGIIPTLSIIDGKVGRKPFHEVVDRLQPTLAVQSGPGFISKKAVQAIHDCFTHPSSPITHHAILIDGEEDLLVLPAIIYAPLGTVLYYGQPGEGLVEVVVTDDMKTKAIGLLARFS